MENVANSRKDWQVVVEDDMGDILTVDRLPPLLTCSASFALEDSKREAKEHDDDDDDHMSTCSCSCSYTHISTTLWKSTEDVHQDDEDDVVIMQLEEDEGLLPTMIDPDHPNLNDDDNLPHKTRTGTNYRSSRDHHQVPMEDDDDGEEEKDDGMTPSPEDFCIPSPDHDSSFAFLDPPVEDEEEEKEDQEREGRRRQQQQQQQQKDVMDSALSQSEPSSSPSSPFPFSSSSVCHNNLHHPQAMEDLAVFKETLEKLCRSMKKSQETRKSLIMTTEKYPRRASVSKVVHSIEWSSRQILDNYWVQLQKRTAAATVTVTVTTSSTL